MPRFSVKHLLLLTLFVAVELALYRFDPKFVLVQVMVLMWLGIIASALLVPVFFVTLLAGAIFGRRKGPNKRGPFYDDSGSSSLRKRFRLKHLGNLCR